MIDVPSKMDEAKFAEALRQMADRAKNEAKYNPTRFLQMLAELGGFGTAKRLLEKREPSDGFTNMVLARRVDLTMEYLIQQAEWSRFFTEDELAHAQKLTNGR